MEMVAKLDGIEKKVKYVTKKNTKTGETVDDMEVFYTMKLAMKKQKIGKDENVKDGTGDPWVRVAISSFDKETFAEYAELPMGTDFIISIDAV